MSVNFGYGSMMGGQMMGGGVNQMAASNNAYFESVKHQYGCEDCFRKSPYPIEWPTSYQPVPHNIVRPNPIKSFFVRAFLGG